MSNTLTITAELAHEIIREKYNLPDNININIVIDNPTKVEVKQSVDWIYVPHDWLNQRCAQSRVEAVQAPAENSDESKESA